jgi:predicted transcriptional regulator
MSAHSDILSLLSFHTNLIAFCTAARKNLIFQGIDMNMQALLQNGFLIFRVLIEKENLSLKRYSQLFSTLDNFIGTISKIAGEPDAVVEIVLLDSGSDTNIGIKTGIETAKSLFLIFKEIWECLFNHEYYKLNKKSETLMKILSVREELQKKYSEGVISKAELKMYSEAITKDVLTLLNLQVLPKQLIDDSKGRLENKQVIAELRRIND